MLGIYVGNPKLNYTTDAKYSRSKFVCNTDSINSIFKEVYRRTILPFYIFFITLIASSLALVERNNENYNKFKLILFVIGIVLIISSEISNSYAFYYSSFKNIILVMPLLSILLLYLLIFFKLKHR